MPEGAGARPGSEPLDSVRASVLGDWAGPAALLRSLDLVPDARDGLFCVRGCLLFALLLRYFPS